MQISHTLYQVYNRKGEGLGTDKSKCLDHWNIFKCMIYLHVE